MKHLLRITVILLAVTAGCKKSDKMSLASVSTTTASSITANSANSGGTIGGTGGTSISKSGICWAMHTNPSVSDSIVSSISTNTGSFSIALSNLNSNTEYYVRAFAINGTGTAYGNVDSFETSKGTPTVTTTAISNIAPLSAHSGGTITNDGGASVTARGLCWSTSAHPTTANFKTYDSLGIGSFTDSLINLGSQTVYFVRAYATNSYGTAYGNELSFTASSAKTILDVEGNVYPYVVIGTQTWMASNLRTSHYQNGDTILNGFSNTNFDWWGNILNSTYTGAYTFPNEDSTNNAQYGKLYNPYAVDDSRGMCPVGWHVPTDGEWETLEFYEGMSASDTGGVAFRGIIGSNLLAGGSSGLNLQSAGEFLIQSGGNSTYLLFNSGGFYWTSSVESSLAREGNFYRAFILDNSGAIERGADFGYAGSIRCIKN